MFSTRFQLRWAKVSTLVAVQIAAIAATLGEAALSAPIEEEMQTEAARLATELHGGVPHRWIDVRSVYEQSEAFTNRVGPDAIPFAVDRVGHLGRFPTLEDRLMLAALARLADDETAADALVSCGRSDGQVMRICHMASFAPRKAARDILHQLIPTAVASRWRSVAVGLARLLEGVGDASSAKQLRTVADSGVHVELKNAFQTSAARIEARLAQDPATAEQTARDSLMFWQTLYDQPPLRTQRGAVLAAARRLNEKGFRISDDFLKEMLASHLKNGGDDDAGAMAVAFLSVQRVRSAIDLLRTAAQKRDFTGQQADWALPDPGLTPD